MSPKHKRYWYDEDGDFGKTNLKGDISTLTINGYFDFFESDNIKLFAGAGLGSAYVKGKSTYSERWRGLDSPEKRYNLKASTNFTYSLHLGASAKIMDNVHTDLTYSWRDFGEIKSKKTDGDFSMSYKGHHLALGIRYDI